MSTLYDFQLDLKNAVQTEWYDHSAQNVLGVLPCRGGKTRIMAAIAREQQRPSRLIAHRQELVGQISMAMARAELVHNIIAPNNVIKFVVAQHVENLGRSFVHSSAPCAVAGVDTLLKRGDPEADQVAEWQTDEAHHLVNDNKWHKVVSKYRGARGAGWTATPCRADRRQLSRASGQGVFDVMVQGPGMRELIDRGRVSPYVIIGPPPSIDRSKLLVSGETGDFLIPGMREAAHRSTIVGDVAATYMKFTPGARAITFAVDEGMAAEHAAAFRYYGIPTEIITYKTPPDERVKHMRDFHAGLVRMIIGIDIFGEGVDVPDLVAIIMARPTQSFPYFVQMFCRPLTVSPGKTHGVIYDHVGNIAGPRGHGLPDGIESWTMSGEAVRRKSSRSVPVRTCENPDCWRAFEGYSLTCPFCGWRPAPVVASRPEMVEGDVTMYGPELLDQLRAQARAAVAGPPDRPRGPRSGKDVVVDRNMAIRKAAIEDMLEAVAWWAGVRRDIHGDDDSMSHRRFYRTFGIDVVSAQSLPAARAAELAAKVREDMYR